MFERLNQRVSEHVLWYVFVLVLCLHGLEILPWLWRSWQEDPYFSHGPLIVLFVAVVVLWRSRQPVQPSQHVMSPFLWPATLAFMLASLSHIDSLQGLFFILLMIACLQWRLSDSMFQHIRMPLFFLLLAVPWPWSLVQMLALPMQDFSARAAAFVLDLFALPVLREGVILDTGQFRLVVEETCSGLRSLVALMTIALYFMALSWRQLSRVRLLLLPFLLFVLVIVANLFRLATAVVIGHFWNADFAMLWVESISPYVLLFVEAWFLFAFCMRPIGTKQPVGMHSWGQAWQAWSFHGKGLGFQPIVLILLLACGFYFQGLNKTHDFKLPEWSAPATWQAQHDGVLLSATAATKKAMGFGAVVRMVRFFPPQSTAFVDGVLVASVGGTGRDADDPRFCYRSSGWRMLAEQKYQLILAQSSKPVSMIELIEESPDHRQLRLDWFAYRVGSQWLDSYVLLRLQQLWQRLQGRLGEIMVVHVSTPLALGYTRADLVAARGRLKAVMRTAP